VPCLGASDGTVLDDAAGISQSVLQPVGSYVSTLGRGRLSVGAAGRGPPEAKRIKTWWRRHRPAAPDLFDQEFAAALDRIAQAPGLGRLYQEGDLDVPIRRVLLPKTLNHVYYSEEGQDVVVLSVWGALHERGPKL
jgi:plasmid stabilization system protein ParE